MQTQKLFMQWETLGSFQLQETSQRDTATCVLNKEFYKMNFLLDLKLQSLVS